MVPSIQRSSKYQLIQKLLTSSSDGVIKLFDVSISNEQNRTVPRIKFLNKFCDKERNYLFHSELQTVV
jgi:hypothetical protein